MAGADVGALLFQPGRRKMCVQPGICHGSAHRVTVQVGAQYRHAVVHGSHHHRPVPFPWPAGVIPLQRGSDGGFTRVGCQTARGLPLLGHFQGQRRKLPAPCQLLHHTTLDVLVRIGVVLLANQKNVCREQRVHPLLNVRTNDGTAR